MQIGKLASGARQSSGMPIRAIAASAGVAASTITRIQSGAVDPTFGTLAQILAAAGFDLRVTATRRFSAPRPALADLAHRWSIRNGVVQIDWTRWRAVLDHLALHPEDLPEAIYGPPWPAGEPIIDNLLAAVAEKLADDSRLPRPSWAAAVPQLTEPYQPPAARRVAGRSVPDQLAARKLFIDTESLWRNRETVGA